MSIFLSGCVKKEAPQTIKESAIKLCIEKCKDALNSGINLTNGPCLSNRIIEDWVCDVAHWPRQEVDNLKENQCPSYGKEANHFVEVNPNCELIRAI